VDRWNAVAEHVRDRREQLGLTQHRAVSSSEGAISLATWRNIEKAVKPPYRRSSLLAVCRVLGWTSDSIDRILDGGEPEEVDAEEPEPETEDLEALTKRLARMERKMGEILETQQEILESQQRRAR
jgi:hypothetical protein